MTKLINEGLLRIGKCLKCQALIIETFVYERLKKQKNLSPQDECAIDFNFQKRIVEIDQELECTCPNKTKK